MSKRSHNFNVPYDPDGEFCLPEVHANDRWWNRNCECISGFFWEADYYNGPVREWRADYLGHSYRAKTKANVIAKARRDPRNNKNSLHRSSTELTEIRTVSSRAQTALKHLRRLYSSSSAGDIDRAAIVSDLEAVVAIVKKWDRP